MKNTLFVGLGIALIFGTLSVEAKPSRSSVSGEVPVAAGDFMKAGGSTFGFWSDTIRPTGPSEALKVEQKKEFSDRTDPQKQSEAWGKASQAAYEILAPVTPTLNERDAWSGHPGALPKVR